MKKEVRERISKRRNSFDEEDLGLNIMQDYGEGAQGDKRDED